MRIRFDGAGELALDIFKGSSGAMSEPRLGAWHIVGVLNKYLLGRCAVPVVPMRVVGTAS